MTFEQALATQPQWIQWWVIWMGAAMAITMVSLLFSKATRRDALFIIVTIAATYFAMMWLYDQIGFVRLLGIVHVVLWTPMAIYLWRRLSDTAIISPYRQIIWLFLATIIISLAFDYADVIRYLLGERASLAI